MAVAAQAAARSWEVCADLCGASLGILCYCDTRRGLASTLGLRGKSCLGVMCSLQIIHRGCVEAHGVAGARCAPVQPGRSEGTGCCTALGLLRRLLYIIHWTFVGTGGSGFPSGTTSAAFSSFGTLAAKSEGGRRPGRSGSRVGAGTGSS